MARPNKNNVDYFPHDAGMRNHKKIKAVRSKYGTLGFSIWVMTLEYIASSDGNVFPQTELEFELMAGDFGVTLEQVTEVIDYCIKLDLLQVSEGFIYSESFDERVASVYEKRNRMKELSRQQRRAKSVVVSSNEDAPLITDAVTHQSKVKESKVNKTKVTEMPDCRFQSLEFADAWINWETHRKQKGVKLTPLSVKKQIEFLERYSEQEAIAVINQSIQNSWTGLFELKHKQNGKRTIIESADIIANYFDADHTAGAGQ